MVIYSFFLLLDIPFLHNETAQTIHGNATFLKLSPLEVCTFTVDSHPPPPPLGYLLFIGGSYYSSSSSLVLSCSQLMWKMLFETILGQRKAILVYFSLDFNSYTLFVSSRKWEMVLHLKPGFL